MEKERKGILTKQQELFLSKAIADKLNFSNALLNRFKLRIARMIIRAADNYGLDRINSGWKEDIIPIVDAAIKGEKDTVRLLVNDLLNKRIDIKGMDEGRELELFDSLTKSLAIAIDCYVLKN